MPESGRYTSVRWIAPIAAGLLALAWFVMSGGPSRAAEERLPSLSFDATSPCFEPNRRVSEKKADRVTSRTAPWAKEATVQLALDWLANHQLPDGSWSFDHTVAAKCEGQCRNPGDLPEARNAATGLALLAFLGAGQTPERGKYQSTAKAGYDYLVGNMKPAAEGRSLYEPGGCMYSHGIAALALCETYAMKKQASAPSASAQWAIDFIAYAQDPVGGGWRYMPRQKGDTSVTGWQMTALRSARLADLRVAPEVLMKASKFLDGVEADGGARYGYLKPATDRPTTTAVGLLMRMHLGWKTDNPALRQGVEWLSEQGPSKTNMYYNYYGQQLMLQVGGEPWKRWNTEMCDHLLATQSRRGHEKGSWYFEGDDLGSERGGRLYSTAMATMTLEVYYRFLPIYSRPSDRQRWRETPPDVTPDDAGTLPE